MTKIYDQHDAAFRNVSAYAVLKDGQHVANVNFKYGAAVTAYIHWFGLEMTRGIATGGGYDRATAAVELAARKTRGGDAPKSVQLNADHFIGVIMDKDDGTTWTFALESNGYTVARVI